MFHAPLLEKGRLMASRREICHRQRVLEDEDAHGLQSVHRIWDVLPNAVSGGSEDNSSFTAYPRIDPKVGFYSRRAKQIP